jgi:hypothetical protein
MSRQRLFWLVPVLGILVAARAAEPDPELVNAEKTLQEAKVETDGASLLRFFRERTLTEADITRLGDAVRRLGDDDFETREKAVDELIRAGRKALPFLRAAERDKDPERSRRVGECLQQIDNRTDLIRIVAAARVLQERRPDGATPVLLAYLPAADDEEAEEAVLRALVVVGMNGGKADAALVKALADKEPLRRAAAGYVLGRADPSQRDAVRRLLTDAEARVRFETAVALARAGDKQAVPALIGLLGDGPMPLGWRAQEILYRIAGEKTPAVALADEKPAERAKVVDAWRGWWKEHEAATNLANINLDETLQGINVICDEMNGGRVWACRADGKPIWEIRGVSAWDAQLLPNGHVLIGEYGGSQVTERKITGEILWTHRVNNTISSCKRLPNGNTFISTFGEMLEVDPKGAIVFSFKYANGGLIARAHHLRNGHLVFASGGDKVVEVDAERKELRTIRVMPNGDSWISVEPLLGERYLIAPYGASKVYETDTAGKIYFECTAEHPMSAVRLPNGNTLVSSNTGRSVMEYDRTGKVVWKLDCGAGVRCVRRY